MKHRIHLLLFILCNLCICQKTFSQCFEIESILVAACAPPGPATEGFNEMVRFRVGSTPLNTSAMTVSWPNNSWQGLVQNATTAAKVVTLNAQVAAANGCGQVLEPIGGVLPANAEVLLVTSYNFSAISNNFGALTEDVYILFQNNATTTSGHFANYSATPGLRTLTILFGACVDSVTYDRTQLSNASGASVNYDPAGNPTYVNNGCVAPVQVFTVDAGPPLSACSGATVSLSGDSVGYTTVLWTASEGTFSTPGSLNTNYTLAASPSASITLTLSASDNCGHTITDTTTITVNAGVTPTFNPVAAICNGAPLAALPTTSINGVTGTWSPAVDNTTTTTYTFTPAVGQCAVPTTLTITVSALTTPTFNAIAPICNGATSPVLPTTSTNSITGTWSPAAVSNTTTATYTFTPNVGQCSSTTTLTVTVNPANTVPTFTTPSSVCSGSPLAPLPTTSLNGITGSWSPAINNTATTTYTFTPDAGQCGVPTNLIINIFPNLTPTFNAVSPICNGDVLSALPTTSINSITGVWTPALNNTATTTYTFTPTAGQCAVATTMIITVNPNVTPTFNAVVTPICSGTTLSALPTTSTNGIVGTWTPALNNTATTTYTFNPNPGQCSAIATLMITVNPSITPTFNPVAAICSGGTLTALPTTSLNGITGSWLPALNNTTTTTYTFTPNGLTCAVPTTVTITVNSIVTPTFNAVAPICIGAPLTALPTTSTNGISGTWSPALNNSATTTYTFTPNAGQCAVSTTLSITVNPTVTPAFSPIAAVCAGTIIPALPTTSTNGITGTWTPALNNSATTTYTFTPNTGQCAVTSTLSIAVNPIVTPTFNPVASICAGTVLSALPTTSLNGITGNWSPALNNTATTTYTFTPNNSGQCGASVSLTIIVNVPVTPTFNAVAPICNGTVLAALPTTSINGITGTWTPALNNIATTTYTFTPTTGQCAVSTTLMITVNQKVTPTFTAVAPICDGGVLSPLPITSTNGIIGTWSPAMNNSATTVYTFTPNAGQCALIATMTIAVNPLVTPTFNPIAPSCAGSILPALPTTATNGIVGTWSPALDNTATTTYTFTPNTGQCATATTMTIFIDQPIIPFFSGVTIPAFACAGGVLAPLPTTSINGITGTWSPAINNSVTTTYTFTPDAGQCATIAALSIVIVDNSVKAETHYVCVDASGNALTTVLIDTGLSVLENSFSWTFNGGPIANTTPSYSTNVPGTYVVVGTNLMTGCKSMTLTAEVSAIVPATAVATVNNDFDDVQQIVVLITGGLGDYEYQLDNGPFQTSNVFYIKDAGDYTINVRDNLGCNSFQLQVTALNFPNFFTPNGDGFNDTWNIKGLPNNQNATIAIFDRYGKLVKEIATKGAGWDGIYNGRELPSSDYWFVLQYEDKNGIKKTFKSHFSLKR